MTALAGRAVTDRDGSRPGCWRHLVEVQDAGRPPDATGYR
jgi:hypothetical protein